MPRPNPRHPRPWHRGSVFGDGRRVPLDRERRARFRFLLHAHARAGRITPKAEWVGLALLKRLGADGQCDPTHDTLAADAACSARTARRATASMRGLGLLRWETRLVRVGWRAEQTSNAYELVPAAAPPVSVPRCGGQTGRETKRIESSYYPQFTTAEIQAAQAALAQRRAAIEGRLLRKGIPSQKPRPCMFLEQVNTSDIAAQGVEPLVPADLG
jgi:hypothetical protein